jgi:hypothetical protein
VRERLAAHSPVELTLVAGAAHDVSRRSLSFRAQSGKDVDHGRDGVVGEHAAEMLQCVAASVGTGKTHLAIGLSIRACQAGHRVLFATAAEWVDRLALAHSAGRLHDELRRLGCYPLIVVDEVGYIPFEAEAANLFFQPQGRQLQAQGSRPWEGAYRRRSVTNDPGRGVNFTCRQVKIRAPLTPRREHEPSGALRARLRVSGVA